MRLRSFSAMPTRASASRASSTSAAFGAIRKRSACRLLQRPSAPAITFCITLRRSTRSCCCAIAAKRVRRRRNSAPRAPARSAPSIAIRPAASGTLPLSARSRLVLPLPLGPTSATHSPAATVSRTPSSAGGAPGA